MNQKTSTQITIQTTPGTIYSPDARSTLLAIIEREGGSLETITTPQLTRLAERLSTVAGGGKTDARPWTRSYLHQVLHGKLAASQRLAHAVMALAAEIGGTNPLLTRSHPVTVQALGNLEPGTIIWGDTQHCANPSCDVPFLRRSPRQRYCSKACRQADQQRKNARAG